MNNPANKYLHGVIGVVSEIISQDKALIEFQHQNLMHKAFLRTDRYYHNGKKIPNGKHLENYLKIGFQVKFSCHIMNNPEHTFPLSNGWFITTGWRHKMLGMSMNVGTLNTPGCISCIKKRHGVLISDDKRRVYFLASKVYIYEKRFPSSKSLLTELNVDDKLFFDAIPCIRQENSENCEWFATIVYKGKRPDIIDVFQNEKQTVHINNGTIKSLDKDILNVDTENPDGEKIIENRQIQLPYIYDVIQQYTSDTRKVYITGRGMFVDNLNDEFGIILGQFKRNMFQSILFHRKHAFLFKMCLAHSKLSDIFKEGDRMKFIVVDAPPKFITDWIAVQVSIDVDENMTFPSSDIDDEVFYDAE